MAVVQHLFAETTTSIVLVPYNTYKPELSRSSVQDVAEAQVAVGRRLAVQWPYLQQIELRAGLRPRAVEADRSSAAAAGRGGDSERQRQGRRGVLFLFVARQPHRRLSHLADIPAAYEYGQQRMDSGRERHSHVRSTHQFHLCLGHDHSELVSLAVPCVLPALVAVDTHKPLRLQLVELVRPLVVRIVHHSTYKLLCVVASQ